MMAAYMISTAVGRLMDCLFICNRVELLEQTASAFMQLGLSFGLIGGGFTQDPTATVNIASIDTLKRRIALRRPPKLIIWDECRGLGAAGWTKVFNAFPDAYHVGLDATPVRTDSKGLGEYFTHLVSGPTYSELMRLGILVPFKVYAPNIPDMAGVKTVRGDFEKAATEAVMDVPTLVGDIVGHFKRYAGNRQGLTFGCSRIHSEHLAAQYRANGISAQHLDGDTDKNERKRIVAAFRRKEIQVLCNVALFTAGFDVPGIEVITDAAPTQSIAIAVQRWGRGSRSESGKQNCILFDHAGNVFRHSLPDSDREWTLAGELTRKKTSGEKAIPVRQCPKCYCCHKPTPSCPECGHVYVVEGRKVKEVNGDLVEMESIAAHHRKSERDKEIKAARTLGDFEAIAAKYQYARGWAWHRFQAKKKLLERFKRTA